MYLEDREPIAAKNILLVLFSSALCTIGAIILVCITVAVNLGGVGLILGIALIIAGCVYPLIIMTHVSNEINIMCEDDGEHLMPYICAFLLGLITFGIYYIYYLYRMQNRMNENGERYGAVINERGGSVVLWYIILNWLFGVGNIVALAIILKNFNKMAYKYNSLILDSNYDSPIHNNEPTYGYIECLSGEMKGAIIKLTEEENFVIIGRDPSMSNIVIIDSKISKQHCIIKYAANEGCFYAKDCTSTNGTKLSNGINLSPEIEIRIDSDVQLILPNDVRFSFGIK